MEINILRAKTGVKVDAESVVGHAGNVAGLRGSNRVRRVVSGGHDAADVAAPAVVTAR